MANTVNFAEEVGNEFLHRFSIFGFNFPTKIAMEVVKFWGIFKVAFHYIPRVAVGGNFHDVKVSNFFLEEEAEISYGQWLTHIPSIKIITV